MSKKVTLAEIEPVIKEILLSGGEVTFNPNGNSMRPMLFWGRDEVTVKASNGGLKKYDLPLYQRENGQFVLHRVVGKNKDGYILRGDNQTVNEYGICDNQIIGVVTRFTRNGKPQNVTDFSYKLYVLLRCNGLTVLLRKIKNYFKRERNEKEGN